MSAMTAGTEKTETCGRASRRCGGMPARFGVEVLERAAFSDEARRSLSNDAMRARRMGG